MKNQLVYSDFKDIPNDKITYSILHPNLYSNWFGNERIEGYTSTCGDVNGCVTTNTANLNELDGSLNNLASLLNQTDASYSDISGQIGSIYNDLIELNANAKYRFKPEHEIYDPNDLSNYNLKQPHQVMQNDSIEMMLQQNNINIIGFIATTSILIASIMFAME